MDLEGASTELSKLLDEVRRVRAVLQYSLLLINSCGWRRPSTSSWAFFFFFFRHRFARSRTELTAMCACQLIPTRGGCRHTSS